MSEIKENPSVEIKIDDQDMYRFNLYHTYTHTNGWLSIIIAVVAFVVAVVTFGTVTTGYTVMYVLLGLMLLVYQPWMLRSASKRQIAASEVLQKPLRYTFKEQGVEIHTEIAGMETGEAPEPNLENTTVTAEVAPQEPGTSAVLKWSQIYKVVLTKHQLLIYGGRNSAYILPVDRLGENKDEILAVISDKLQKFQRRGF